MYEIIYKDDSFKVQIKDLEKFILSNLSFYNSSFSPVIISSYLLMKNVPVNSSPVNTYLKRGSFFVKEYTSFSSDVSKRLNIYIRESIETYLQGINENILNLLGATVAEIIDNIESTHTQQRWWLFVKSIDLRNYLI